MNAKLLLCLAALPAAVDALGEWSPPVEVTTTSCPNLVPIRLNATDVAGSLSGGTIAMLDSHYRGSDLPAVIVGVEILPSTPSSRRDARRNLIARR